MLVTLAVFLTFLALAVKMPQPPGHVRWVIFLYFKLCIPRVLSLQVLYICYCPRPCKWNGKTAGEGLAADTKMSKDSIQEDIESRVHARIPTFLPGCAVGPERAGIIITAHVLHHHGVRCSQPCGQFELSDSEQSQSCSCLPSSNRT